MKRTELIVSDYRSKAGLKHDIRPGRKPENPYEWLLMLTVRECTYNLKEDFKEHALIVKLIL